MQFLVGEEDVGKNTIVEHLALQILNDQVPEKLFDKRLVKIDLTQLFQITKILMISTNIKNYF